MAPSKRRAEETDDDDDEVEVDVVDSASSNFRASGSKRQRLSIVPTVVSDDGEPVDSTPSSVEREMELNGDLLNGDLPNGTPDMIDLETGSGMYTSTQMRNAKSFQEQYDDVWAEPASEDEEATDQRATQQVRRKQKNRPVLNQAAECGIIESVTCINFMCHTKLEVKLGPLINFVVGHNGSGKSAVLTAITLCLGGKATSTNRGQSLKSFVKEGQDSSTLTVKIKNQGPTAFKANTYGESIIVERHFTIHGTTTFKIKNEQGRIVSTKRVELDDLLDWYALQLDNPVNVLTQDMARQFLNNSTANDKYKLFVKGVQLEQLDHDYVLVGESINATEARLVTVQDDILVLHKRKEAAAEKFNKVKKLDNSREKLNSLRRQMVWAQVQEQEAELEKRQKDLKDCEHVVENQKRDAVNISKDLDDLDKNLENIRLALSEKDNEDQPLQEQSTLAKEAHNKAKQAMQEIITEEREAHSTVQADKRRVSEMKKKIEEERRRLEAADDGSTASKLAELEQAEQSFKVARSEFEVHQGQETLDRLRSEESEAKDKTIALGRALDDKKAAHESANNRLVGLKSSRNGAQQWAMPNMAALIRAVEKEKRFHSKPIGPAGDYVRLTKPQWSSIVERFFGRSLNAFVTSNKHDSTILLELAHRNNCDVPVMIAPTGRFGTVQTSPDDSFSTVERILEIDNDLVRNMFMAQHGIDQCILVEDSNEAAQIMFTNKPRNVKRCIAMHPTKRGWGMSYTFNMFGDEKIEPVNPWAGTPRMKTDLEIQIRLQEESVQAHKQELHTAEMNQKEATSNLTKCKQAFVKHERDKKALQTRCDRAEEQVIVLREELEAMRPQEGMLDAHKQSLEQAENTKDMNQSQFDLIQRRKGEISQDLQQKEEEVKRLKDNLDAKQKAKDRVSSRLAKTEEQRTKTLREKNEALEKVNDAENTRQEQESKVKTQEETIVEFTAQATEFCARVPVPRGASSQSLNERCDALKKDLQNSEQAIGGSKEQLWNAYKAADNAFSLAKQHEFRLSGLVRGLSQTLFDRFRRWKRFRSEISARARAEFKSLLANRQFRGSLEFNHKSKLLDISVEPDSTRRDANGRQTKTLSGGEKSFSTVCMLLALWNAMGSPIRCLDEFDVFMDSANRDVSTKMLIAAARESVGRQFILITPQSMGNIPMAEDVKVIRLSDPERGQTALNFSGA